MTTIFTPRLYQSVMIEHVIKHPRCNIWSGMGTGKSVAVLTALDILRFVDDDEPILILAPLRVCRSVWPAECKKWSHLVDTDIRAALGDARKRIINANHRITAINYDMIPWLVENYAHRWRWRIVIADESTRLKSFRLSQGGLRAQKLAAVAHRHVTRWINLTGTPAPNGLKDLWGQAWFLDAGERLGRSFTAFTTRWFQHVAKSPGAQYTNLVPYAHAQAEIEGLLSDITLTVDIKYHMVLPPLIENTIEVELPARARKHYREMERELFTTLKSGSEIVAQTAAVKSMKCLQCASGAIYTGEDGRWEEVHDVKIDALRSIIEEAAGMPVLVAYHFKPDLERLLKAFPSGKVLDNSDSTIEAWNNGKIPILFAHPQSAGHGLNLQDGGNIIVFFTIWWALEPYEQIIERIGPTRQAQSGHNRPVYVHHIVATNTLDEDVLERVRSKASVQSILLQAMEKRITA